MNEEPVGQSINSILIAMDDLIAKASNPATTRDIAAERVGIGQIKTRCELLLSFLETSPSLRLIRNA